MKNRNRTARDDVVDLCDQLIELLEQVEDAANTLSHEPTVDVGAMLSRAKNIRERLDEPITRSRLDYIREWLAFGVQVAKDIHSMINCYSRSGLAA